MAIGGVKNKQAARAEDAPHRFENRVRVLQMFHHHVRGYEVKAARFEGESADVAEHGVVNHLILFEAPHVPVDPDQAPASGRQFALLFLHPAREHLVSAAQLQPIAVLRNARVEKIVVVALRVAEPGVNQPFELPIPLKKAFPHLSLEMVTNRNAMDFTLRWMWRKL
jgi:hypothetical protein